MLRHLRTLACLVALLAAASPSRALPPLQAEPFEVIGDSIEPGSVARLSFVTSESFAGISVGTPIIVAHGAFEGPVLCLTGGVHGDELNGVEIVRRTMDMIDTATLAGTVLGVPIANPQGFRRSSRYLPDRRDLNRYFPGRGSGSSASRIAHALFHAVVRRCDALVDFHTGSFYRTNVPHLRANVLDPPTRRLAEDFGTPVIVHNVGRPGTLRRSATDAGIPAITYEGGQPMRLSEVEIGAGVAGTVHLMAAMGLNTKLNGGGFERRVEHRIYVETHWVRAGSGGLLIAKVGPGDLVEVGSLLGAVTDPISSERTEILSPHRGVVLGQALDQVVMPGFAAFNVAVENGRLNPLAGLGEAEEPVFDEEHQAELEERPE